MIPCPFDRHSLLGTVSVKGCDCRSRQFENTLLRLYRGLFSGDSWDFRGRNPGDGESKHCGGWTRGAKRSDREYSIQFSARAIRSVRRRSRVLIVKGAGTVKRSPRTRSLA